MSRRRRCCSRCTARGCRVAFVAAAGAVRRWAARPRVWQVVAVGNGGAMTLYLWHIPAIAVATFSLHAVGLDAYDVDAQGFWAMLALRALVFAVVMAAAFWLLSPLEHRRLPWWDCAGRRTGARSAAAGALVCIAGVVLVLARQERAWRCHRMDGPWRLRRRRGRRAASRYTPRAGPIVAFHDSCISDSNRPHVWEPSGRTT